MGEVLEIFSWAVIAMELVQDQLSHSFGMHIKTLYCAYSQSYLSNFLISRGAWGAYFWNSFGMTFGFLPRCADSGGVLELESATSQLYHRLSYVIQR
jgi:hypothetical protein